MNGTGTRCPYVIQLTMSK